MKDKNNEIIRGITLVNREIAYANKVAEIYNNIIEAQAKIDNYSNLITQSSEIIEQIKEENEKLHDKILYIETSTTCFTPMQWKKRETKIQELKDEIDFNEGRIQGLQTHIENLKSIILPLNDTFGHYDKTQIEGLKKAHKSAISNATYYLDTIVKPLTNKDFSYLLSQSGSDLSEISLISLDDVINTRTVITNDIIEQQIIDEY